jgi:hypothetical protein
MIRKTFFIGVICMVCLLLSGPLLSQMKATFHIEGDGVGYVLLNGVITTFEGPLPGTSEEVKKRFLTSLNRLMAEARIARSREKIDAAFFERFKRILLVLNLVILKEKNENQVLDSFIIQEVNQFHTSQKMGEEDMVMGIGSVAGAVAEELLSLKKYLDNQKK